MNYLRTLTGTDLTHDINGSVVRIASLEVYNGGPDTLYTGDIPEGNQTLFASEMGTVTVTSGSPNVVLGADPPAWLQQGMVLQSSGIGSLFTAGTTFVKEIRGRVLIMSENATGSDTDADGVFSAPALDSTTGLPIAAGETRLYTSGDDNPMLNRPRRFFAASGTTCAVRFCVRRN